jgi:predicted TIM-barrel fold metal-dependent hydrolase
MLLPRPDDTPAARATYGRAVREGVPFVGVKPYFDLLGKSNYETRMGEFVPDDLLDFMDAEGLVMMLHTAGLGMGEPDNQSFVLDALERWPRLRIVLAHMGRYLEVEDFMRFADSAVFGHPRLYLEMSSASRVEVYERTLSDPSTHDRLLFGSDLPFGAITGVEDWSAETGPVFVTRDRYSWSDEEVDRRFADKATGLTYNTYHVIDAFRRALDKALPDPDAAGRVKRRVFRDNALSLFGSAPAAR